MKQLATFSGNTSILLPPCIETNVSLKDKNWFKTGGNARYFAQPTTGQEFQEALVFAHSYSLDVFILGEGANILISDDGFDGLVIKPNLNAIEIINVNQVKAGAGVSMSTLITYCLDHNLLGLEEFSGIPGTVGGSVYINLHYFEFLLGQFLVNAEIIDKTTGQLFTVATDWFNFGYNYSKLHEGNFYLASATFSLRSCTELEAAFAKGRSVEIIRHRKQRYPNSNTCGSFFRNFTEQEVTLMSNNKKMIYVAYYLDKIGVKGQLKRGDAIVSYQHANMVVNQGNATSSDIIELVKEMQRLVLEQFGIVPQPECRLIGFKEYPLLKQEDVY